MSRRVILFLAANPPGTTPLGLGEECAAIQRELKMAPYRDDFQFESRWAVGIDELMRHLLDLQPVVLHFSGHGDMSGLLLVGDDGRPHAVTATALTQMLKSTARTVRVVVLNACYADAQAEALRDVVGCAIGMKGKISDDAARAFAVGFYRALGYRRPVGNAYAQAEATLAGKGLAADAQPRCLVRVGVDVDELVLGGDVERSAAPDAQPGKATVLAAPVDAVSEYVRFGLRRHSRALVVGSRSTAIPIDLDRVFVPRSFYADRARMGGEQSSREAEEEWVSTGGAELSLDGVLACANNSRRCLALLGDPGAGKTTLLRHLFCSVARGAVTSSTSHLRDLHPVLIRLSAVTHDEQVARGLARVVARIANEDGYPEAGPAILRRSNQGLLFLLDGLDEVRDASNRRRICSWLNDEIDHWPASTFIVTSRRAAWTLTPDLASRFLPVSVQGLCDNAIAEYVQRWFSAVAYHFLSAVDPPSVIRTRAHEGSAALLEVLAAPSWRSNTRLIEMTANPLMLSTLCLAYYSDSRLPARRGELYERVLKLLIEVWTRERTGTEALQFEAARLILQPLAYAMHEQGRRELTTQEATDLVREPWMRLPKLRAVTATPETFLELLRDDCGVLTSRHLGRIEFAHLSFQEYLAACHVASCGLGRTLAEHAGDPRWEEVILLAMSRPGAFEPFMHRALERDDVEVALLRQCLREAVEICPAPLEDAAERALDQMPDPDLIPAPAAAELRRVFEIAQGYDLPRLVDKALWVVDGSDPALRAVARQLLSRKAKSLETTAPGKGNSFVEPVTNMQFVWIPGGEFMMGSSNKPGQPSYDPEGDLDEVPAHCVQLSGFWMSMYPVTNEVYARFVAETTHAAPRAFTDRRFNDPAQPVVTVTWYDAQLFTDWFTDQLAGVVARVPTEAEWEYAARGSDGRRYPWGNESPDASRATFGQPFETGRPAAVGHTPDGKSPFDVHDLAGNVREWCLDAWTPNYAKAGAVDPRGDSPREDDSRVVRGGSWNLGPRGLRSAFRGGFDPQHHDLNLGFRIVCESMDRADSACADAAPLSRVNDEQAPSLPPGLIGTPEVGANLEIAACEASSHQDVGTSRDIVCLPVNTAAQAFPERGLPVPTYRLHSLRQILIVQVVSAFVMGSPLAGVWMLFSNFRRLRQPRRALIMLAVGLLYLLAIATTAILIADFGMIIRVAFKVGVAITVIKVARITQGKSIADHERQGGKMASGRIAFSIWLASMLVTKLLMAMIAITADLINADPSMESHEDVNVHYHKGATELEARAVEDALTQLGASTNQRQIFLSREANRSVVSVVVHDFVFSDSGIMYQY